ncbi:MAG: gephyrin-like molybdotransferase Glp, partial [Pseudomonadota bacterium]
DEALDSLFALVSPLETETVALREAAGRVLAAPVVAQRAQPPFDASSMDGYAIRSEDAVSGKVLQLIGEAPAGHGFEGEVGPGKAVRIFTGAPLPAGADHVEIQENVSKSGEAVTLNAPEAPGANVRRKGRDFSIGHELSAPRRLTPADIMLAAAMNAPEVTVTKRPEIALISTGDELVMPGEEPRPDQIIASNSLGLAALVEGLGALPRVLPIAKDNPDSLASAFRFARGADLIVTIGGASVGDHDLVRSVAGELGLEQSFYKVAMRPGKPLMAGKLNGTPILGLPGNPVSSLVCGHIFLKPMLNVFLGLPPRAAVRLQAPLAHDLPANGPREHYMRAQIKNGALHVFDRQDSSLTTVLSEANVLAVRAPNDPARLKGAMLPYVPLHHS